MSPVSLLDAAASHVSLTITEIARIAFIRRATPAEQEQFHGKQSTTNGHVYGRRSVEDSSSPPRRTPPISTPPSRTGTGDSTSRNFLSKKGTSNGTRGNELGGRRLSDPSNSSDDSSPPVIVRRQVNGNRSDRLATQEGAEDAWSELKVRHTRVLEDLVDR